MSALRELCEGQTFQRIWKRPSLNQAMTLKKHGATAIVLIMVMSYFLFFSAMVVRQHDALQTHVFDLGNVDQTVWNTVHGRPLHFTTQPAVGEHRMGMHVEPILFLISLSYLVYPNPKTLLVIQTLALALGAIPLYALARRRLGSPWAALAFPFAYLMLPALQSVNLFEFHAVALAPLFLLSAFYFMDRATWPKSRTPASADTHRLDWILYAAFVLFALSCKEDISLIVMLLGVYVAVLRKRWLAGVLTFVVGLVWFYTAVYVVIPHFRPAGSPFLAFYANLGGDPISMVWTLLTQPKVFWEHVYTAENARVLMALLLPLAGLPILGFPFWILAGPSLGISLLSNNPLMHRMERYHYAASMIPVILTAAVFGLDWLSRVVPGKSKRGRSVRVTVLATLIVVASLWYHYHRGFTPLSRSFSWPDVTPHHRMLDEIVGEIPADAVISAQANLFPHVSQRERAYLWPDPRDKEYVLLDVSDPSFWNKEGAQEGVKRDLEQDESFGWTLARDGYLVLKRGAKNRPLPDEFFSFLKVDDPQPLYPMTVDFGDAVRLLGFSPLYEREEEVRFYLYFQALRPLEEDYAVTLYLTDEEGSVVGGTDRSQPALVWHPTSHWQPGETIEVMANTLTWWTGDRDHYAVALGVSEGNDVWNVGSRLQPKVVESDRTTPVLADETLLQLLPFWRSWELHYPEAMRRRYDVSKMARQVEASFAGKADLTGYTVARTRLNPGETVDLTLSWRSLSPWEDSYKVFIHLRGPDGVVVAQQDTVPGEGQLPTTNWLTGEYVIDAHHIPVGHEVPAGRYNLAVGLYDPETLARMPVTGDAGIAKGDHMVLDQEVEIVNR